jgi:tetratricopeptide (TPR) repeat protein/transglutaminase-like putative cysteine protease
MCKPLLVFAVLSASLPCVTQTPSDTRVPKTTSSTPSYAEEAVVVERDDVVYHFASDGTGSKLETSVVRIQSTAALQIFGVLGFPYASSNQRLDIVYTRVRKPDGTVVETPATDSQEQPAQATQVAPMYSDLHLKQIPVRSLAVGDKLEFQVRMTQQQPEVPNEFWGQENFGAGFIYLERSIELHVPKQKRLTVYSPDHTPETSDSVDEHIYRWTGSQLHSPSAKNDDDAPHDKTPPIAWTTFPNWEAVGLWYRGLIAGRDAVTPAIKAKADELTVNAKTDTDKVRALYEYVSTHNHYIGIDFGIGRYQPHSAAEVMTNQYGDCKDKHTLLSALLQAEGFQVSAVLIGTGIEMNEKVPMPAAFNHLITQVNVGGEKTWLDATTEVAPYRVLLPMLRDKNALVVPPAAAPGLQKTPAQLPFPSVNRYEIKSELDKSGSLKGHVEVSMRSDSEILMRLATRQVARTQWDQLSQGYQNASGYDGTTTATALDPADDTSGPWHMRYDFAKSPFGDWPNFRIGSLLPNADLATIDEKDPPKKEIELGALHTQIASSTIRLPQGYSADLPDAVHLKTAFASIDKTYQLKDGSLISDLHLETFMAKVPAAEWKDYKKFLDDIGQDPWIQLTSKEHTAGEKGPPPAGENNPVAAELVRQVHIAIVAKDYDLARKKSDLAISINDKQSYVWSQRGFLADVRNDYQESVDDYQKELSQHPENVDQYPGLISAAGKAGKKAQQRDALLAYAKAEPKKDTAILYIGNLLLSTDNVSDAVDVYRAGAKDIPENKLIQVELASALLRLGKPDEAITVVKAALDGSSDPDVLNDGAYVLASHNTDLALAESSARKAVDVLETESTQTILTSVNAKNFHRITLLLASWDTLGWIYFAEGKTDLAEQYVRGAWKSSTHAEEGLHLGQILEKRGDKTQAMQVYEMSVNGTKGNSATPVVRDLHSRIDALKKDGVHQQNPHTDAFQEQRTFHISRPANLKGSAIFLAQVSSAKTEKMEFVSGDESLRSQSEPLAHLDLGLAVPKDSHALLLRIGILFCSTQATCEFILTPPESANVK